MRHYPFRFQVSRPQAFSHEQLGLRVLFLLLIGVAGLSVTGVLGFLFLALPLYAALRISDLGSGERYVLEDRDRVVTGLHWLASITTWVGLVTDRVSFKCPSSDVDLALDLYPRPHPSVGNAAWRIVTGLPSALFLMLLSFVGVFVWLFGAVSILVGEQVPESAHRYLTGLQRYTYRLLAYQAALIDEYPPFALSDPDESDEQTSNDAMHRLG